MEDFIYPVSCLECGYEYDKDEYAHCTMCGCEDFDESEEE